MVIQAFAQKNRRITMGTGDHREVVVVVAMEEVVVAVDAVVAIEDMHGNRKNSCYNGILQINAIVAVCTVIRTRQRK